MWEPQSVSKLTRPVSVGRWPTGEWCVVAEQPSEQPPPLASLSFQGLFMRGPGPHWGTRRPLAPGEGVFAGRESGPRAENGEVGRKRQAKGAGNGRRRPGETSEDEWAQRGWEIAGFGGASLSRRPDDPLADAGLRHAAPSQSAEACRDLPEGDKRRGALKAL